MTSLFRLLALVLFAAGTAHATAQNTEIRATTGETHGDSNQPAAPQVEQSSSVFRQPASAGVRLEQPGSLHDIKRAIEQCFGIPLSVEPLPEQCAGAVIPEAVLDPFFIVEGEAFETVAARLEAASGGRWKFEEVRGIPLLRAEAPPEGAGALLDTVVDLNIAAPSVWDALCALARAVNEQNHVGASGRRPLMIMFLAPSLMRRPPRAFTEQKTISVSIQAEPARNALCAILAQAGVRAGYFYTCVAPGKRPGYDYVTVMAYGAGGKPESGPRIRDDEYLTLLKSVDWMSDERMLAVQAPSWNVRE